MNVENCLLRSPDNVRVKNYNVNLITFDHPLMEKIYKIKELPLKRAQATFDLHNVSAATANAIRRTIIDETEGYALEVNIKDYEIDELSDKTAVRHFVMAAIGSIPLKCVIPDDILQNVKFSIDVSNDTNDPIMVFSSDIKCNKKIKDILFNPGYIIAILNPKTRLRIHNIRIVKDIGLNNTFCKSACNVTMIPLDREEYSKEELDENPALKMLSKYKYPASQKENLNYRITFELNSVESKYEVDLFVQSALKSLITNFNILLNEDYDEYVSDLEDNVKLLKFESTFTSTLFEPLKRSIFDITKNQVPLFYYEYVSNEHISRITIKDENPLELLREGVNNIIKIITNILKEFN